MEYVTTIIERPAKPAEAHASVQYIKTRFSTEDRPQMYKIVSFSCGDTWEKIYNFIFYDFSKTLHTITSFSRNLKFRF